MAIMKTIGVPTKRSGISFVKCVLLIACVVVGGQSSRGDSLEVSNLVSQIATFAEYDESGKLISMEISSRYHNERNIKLVSEIPSLKELIFRGNSGSNAVPLTPAVMGYVTGMTNLTKLSLACFISNRLKDGVLNEVSKMRQLENLTLFYSEAPKEEYSGLTNLVNLTKLRIICSTNFGDAELQLLTNLTKLRELELEDNSVTSNGTNLLKNLKSLTNVVFEPRQPRTFQNQLQRQP